MNRSESPPLDREQFGNFCFVLNFKIWISKCLAVSGRVLICKSQSKNQGLSLITFIAVNNGFWPNRTCAGSGISIFRCSPKKSTKSWWSFSQTVSTKSKLNSILTFALVIQALGEQLKVKQQVIATAIVYFKRFYVKNSFKCIDPLLLAPTCLFLASKVEEFGVISNNRLISTCQQVGKLATWRRPPRLIRFSFLVKNKFCYAYPQEFPYRISQILECEFYLMEIMDCCLVLYHPYRPLAQFVHECGSKEILHTAW